MKNKLNEKEQIIYCVLIVISLIILLSGDQIVLKAIPKKPNNNERVFKGLEPKDNLANQSELTITEINELLSQKNSFFLFFSRKDCYTCELMTKRINELDSSLIYPIYYLNRDHYDLTNEEYKSFIAIDNRITEKESLTPLILKFTNGYLEDTLVGLVKKVTVQTREMK